MQNLTFLLAADASAEYIAEFVAAALSVPPQDISIVFDAVLLDGRSIVTIGVSERTVGSEVLTTAISALLGDAQQLSDNGVDRVMTAGGEAQATPSNITASGSSFIATIHGTDPSACISAIATAAGTSQTNIVVESLIALDGGERSIMRFSVNSSDASKTLSSSLSNTTKMASVSKAGVMSVDVDLMSVQNSLTYVGVTSAGVSAEVALGQLASQLGLAPSDLLVTSSEVLSDGRTQIRFTVPNTAVAQELVALSTPSGFAILDADTTRASNTDSTTFYVTIPAGVQPPDAISALANQAHVSPAQIQVTGVTVTPKGAVLELTVQNNSVSAALKNVSDATLTSIGVTDMGSSYSPATRNTMSVVLTDGTSADFIARIAAEFNVSTASIVIYGQHRNSDGQLVLSFEITDDKTAAAVASVPPATLHIASVVHNVQPPADFTMVVDSSVIPSTLPQYLASKAGVTLSAVSIVEEGKLPDGRSIVTVRILNPTKTAASNITSPSNEGELAAAGVKQVRNVSEALVPSGFYMVIRGTTAAAVVAFLRSFIVISAPSVVPLQVASETMLDTNDTLIHILPRDQSYSLQLIEVIRVQHLEEHGVIRVFMETYRATDERSYVGVVRSTSTVDSAVSELVAALRINKTQVTVSSVGALSDKRDVAKLSMTDVPADGLIATTVLTNFELLFSQRQSNLLQPAFVLITANASAFQAMDALAARLGTGPASFTTTSIVTMPAGGVLVRFQVASAELSADLRELLKSNSLPPVIASIFCEAVPSRLSNTFLVVMVDVVSDSLSGAIGYIARTTASSITDLRVHAIWTSRSRTVALLEATSGTLANAISGISSDAMRSEAGVQLLYRQSPSPSVLTVVLPKNTALPAFVNCLMRSLDLEQKDVTVLSSTKTSDGRTIARIEVLKDSISDTSALLQTCRVDDVYDEAPQAPNSIVLSVMLGPRTIINGAIYFLALSAATPFEDLRILSAKRLSDNTTVLRLEVSSMAVATAIKAICDSDLASAGILSLYVEGSDITPAKRCTKSCSFVELTVACNMSLTTVTDFLGKKLNLTTPVVAVMEGPCDAAGRKPVTVVITNNTDAGTSIGQMPTGEFTSVGIYNLQGSSGVNEASAKTGFSIWIIICLALALVVVSLIIGFFVYRHRSKLQEEARIQKLQEKAARGEAYEIPKGDEVERHCSRLSIRTLHDVELKEQGSVDAQGCSVEEVDI